MPNFGDKIMAGILDSVNQRTQLVGQNRLELLLFRLGSKQIYGINVFKVKEVLQCPELTQLPKSHRVIRGVAHIRGGTISVMDLSAATGGPPLDDIKNCFIIIAEYNTKTQGFLVKGVERIINMNWEDIMPPPKGTGSDHYLTAVTKLEDQMIEIIDVEKVLSEVSPVNEEISEGVVTEEITAKARSYKILVADDSKIARKQVTRCIQQIGVEVVSVCDGREAWEHLLGLLDQGIRPQDEYLMIISDIEMPEMDGYTLTAHIRDHASLNDICIVLHTSLSGVFNQAMVKKVGADDFLAKFHPDKLAEKVVERIEASGGTVPALEG
jgi:two-component system, chemotaxis family, chemotaxis protein CheV